MPTYNFLNLSPIEFEELTRDLLQAHLGIYLDNFTAGRDSGIDLRHSTDDDGTLIVQCKRYQTYRQLKANLKEEMEKVKKLDPDSYIISTSAGLTPANKDEMIKLGYGYIKDGEDIFSRENLNNLLGLYPEIERRHFKLWLSSTEMLQSIINCSIINRSDFTEDEINNTIQRYVPNNSFNDAIQILQKYNYVIVSGNPGVGKTTLAKMLIFKYMEKGYQVVEISNDIEEGEKIFRKSDKQVFYYDDFLGSNFLDRSLNKNEDSRLVKFIKKIKSSDNKKLIMTTREYILNQARLKYEKLDSTNIEIGKCIIDLEKYSKLIKAKILYNHLLFAGLPKEYTNNILTDRKYKLIIQHKNYNPRVIEYMTFGLNQEVIKPDSYFKYFIDNLNNPIGIWKHAFENQISETSKYVLYIVLLSGYIFEQDLKPFFESIIKNESEKYGLEANRSELNKCLRELENTFIKIQKDYYGNNYVVFQNPSISDFLLNTLKEDLALIESLFIACPFFDFMFNIFHTSKLHPNEKRIQLQGKLLLIFEDLVLTKFDILSDRIKYNLMDDLQIIGRRSEINILNRLLKLSTFFELTASLNVVEFITNKLYTIDISAINGEDKETYIELIKNLANVIPFDENKIISEFYRATETIQELREFSKFGEIFSETYEDFLLENDSSIQSKAEVMIRWQFIELDKDSEEDLKNFLEDMETIESQLGYDLTEQTKEVKELLVGSDEYEPDEDDRDYYRGDTGHRDDEDTFIDEMFMTLKDF